jgi:hypothetical protein
MYDTFIACTYTFKECTHTAVVLMVCTCNVQGFVGMHTQQACFELSTIAQYSLPYTNDTVAVTV